MAKNLFARYIWELTTIYRAGRITLKELNERWQDCYLYDGKDIDKFEMYTMFHSCIMNICKYAYQFKDVSFENSKYVSDLMEVDFDRDMEYFAACNVFRLTRECDPKDRKIIENIEGKYLQYISKNVNELGKSRMFW